MEPRLFGLPVVLTTAMLVDKFLVGNFRAAATIYDRWTARVEVATEHADFFVRNLVAILAEERLALGDQAARRPGLRRFRQRRLMHPAGPCSRPGVLPLRGFACGNDRS